jgi:hypothetical protein
VVTAVRSGRQPKIGLLRAQSVAACWRDAV